jgi:hypothetical protein
MVVFALSSISGLQRWVDYIPVKFSSSATEELNSYSGSLIMDFLGSSSGLKGWVDYIPVYIDSNATDAWVVNSVGYIPASFQSNPTLSLNFLSSLLDSRITFTRASTKTYYDIAGVRQTAAINEAPLEYDPITHELLGRSVWEARTNSLLNSDAPVTQVVTLGVGTYTLWVEGSGSATSSALTAVGSGFGAATAGSPNVFTVSTGGTVNVTVAGSLTVFQLENGAFATPYIPTTGTPVTRAADVASVTGTNFSSWYNQSEGAFVAEYMTSKPNGTVGNCYPFSCNDGTNAERVNYFISLSGGGNPRITAGGVSTNPGNPGTQINLAFNKVGVAYKVGANQGRAALNGALGTASTPAAQPATTRLEIGQNISAEHINGWIRSIKYYPTRLSDAQLQALTA